MLSNGASVTTGFDRKTGVAVLTLDVVSSSCGVATTLEAALICLQAVQTELRAVVLIMSAPRRGDLGVRSERMSLRIERAIRALHSIGVPIVSLTDGQGAMGTSGASLVPWLAADYRIVDHASTVCVGGADASSLKWLTGHGASTSDLYRAQGRQRVQAREAQRLGLASEVTETPRAAEKRAIQFAAWLAHHPAVGVKNMLALTRRTQSSAPHTHEAMAAAAAARLSLLNPFGTAAEVKVHIERLAGCVAGATPPQTRSGERTRASFASAALPASLQVYFFPVYTAVSLVPVTL